MKSYKKVLLIGVLFIVIVGGLVAYRACYVQKSYYPMGGEVTIVGKSRSGSRYYIVIDEGTGEQFTLSCGGSDYNKVDVGDTVDCERSQSIVTHRGEVHKVK